jgi:putative transposase
MNTQCRRCCLVKVCTVLGSSVMTPKELLTETVEMSSIECWDDESTASALRALAVRLHSTGVSLQETVATLESIGVNRSHQAVFQWVHRVGEEGSDPPTVEPSRVAVDETAIKIGREQCWLYAAIDMDSKLLLGVRVSRWRGTTARQRVPFGAERTPRSLRD